MADDSEQNHRQDAPHQTRATHQQASHYFYEKLRAANQERFSFEDDTSTPRRRSCMAKYSTQIHRQDAPIESHHASASLSSSSAKDAVRQERFSPENDTSPPRRQSHTATDSEQTHRQEAAHRNRSTRQQVCLALSQNIHTPDATR
jgi:hypothetical protein